MRLIRLALAALSLALVVPVLAVAPASAGPDPVADARGWLVGQQEADGGFELADFAPFETPDAILAIATAGQTGSVWSTAEALAAVQAVDNQGVTALDWADDFVDGGVSAGVQAKFALLVALPLGLDPAAFDPQNDGAADLTVGLGTIDPGLFNSFLVGAITQAAIGVNVPQDDLQTVCEAQQAVGGWSFDADPTGSTGADPDTTGFATMALTAAGVGADDPVVAAAATFFETTQDQAGVPGAPPVPAGGFFSFGSLDPNATALATQGYAAAGRDPVALPTDPTAFLTSLQVPGEGRIASPNDGFGVNTFATSQTIQALKLLTGGPRWLPLAGGGNRACLPTHFFTDMSATAWNDNALRWLARYGLATGYADGSFRPLVVFNRSQASQWFSGFFPDVVGAPNPFPDVPPGAWFERGADFVGDPSWPGGAIATGFAPSGEFRGVDPFSRGQAILWMYKAAGRPDVADLPAHGFSDGAPWIEDALRWAAFHGIVTGFSDGSFRPNEQINRGQGAFWFYNLAANPAAWAPGVTLPATIVHTAPTR
jgi:hypothetical protein